MGIDAKEGFLKKPFKKTDSVRITFVISLFFKNDFILLIDDKLTKKKAEDTLYLGLKWEQKKLWKNTRSVKKLILAYKDNNRDKSEDGAIREKNIWSKVNMIEK